MIEMKSMNSPLRKAATNFSILQGRRAFSAYNERFGVKKLLVSYFVRKYEGIELSEARELVKCISQLESFDRVRYVVGADVEDAGVFSAKRHQEPVHGRWPRADYYELAETGEGDEPDNFFGRLLKLFKFCLDCDAVHKSGGLDGFQSSYQVALMDWACHVKQKSTQNGSNSALPNPQSRKRLLVPRLKTFLLSDGKWCWNIGSM